MVGRKPTLVRLSGHHPVGHRDCHQVFRERHTSERNIGTAPESARSPSNRLGAECGHGTTAFAAARGGMSEILAFQSAGETPHRTIVRTISNLDPVRAFALHANKIALPPSGLIALRLFSLHIGLHVDLPIRRVGLRRMLVVEAQPLRAKLGAQFDASVLAKVG